MTKYTKSNKEENRETKKPVLIKSPNWRALISTRRWKKKLVRGRQVPLLSSASSSRECSESGSTGAWSTATLFWLMIFSFSFGLGFLRRDAVADKLWSWQSPDSVKQTPSWVYVLDRSEKTRSKKQSGLEGTYTVNRVTILQKIKPFPFMPFTTHTCWSSERTHFFSLCDNLRHKYRLNDVSCLGHNCSSTGQRRDVQIKSRDEEREVSIYCTVTWETHCAHTPLVVLKDRHIVQSKLLSAAFSTSSSEWRPWQEAWNHLWIEETVKIR